MSDTITIARPYAKAIFEHALDKGKLKLWSELLFDLAQIILNDQARAFITNPAATDEQHIALLSDTLAKAAGSESDTLTSFVKILAHNDRLLVLPDIYTLFEVLRAEQEKTLVAEVYSYSAMNAEQQQRLSNTLSQRLQRQVTIKLTIDQSLLGGAIIRAGDLVIDGSVRGKLNKLGADLAA